MITLEDFLNLACDDSYELSVWDCDKQEEIIHNKSVGEITDYLQENNIDLLFRDIQSWDIDYITKNFTINI